MTNIRSITKRNKVLLEEQINMFNFLKDVSREMRKVTWPKSSELVSYTITVVLTVAFVALFFAVIDLGITQLLNKMPFLNN